MPGPGARQMACGQKSGTVAGSVLPYRVHIAATDRHAGTAERTRDLSHLVPRRIGNVANDCGGPKTVGRRHRFPRCLTYLGTEPTSSSAYSLCGAWRRPRSGRREVDWVPEENVFSSSRSVEQPVPKCVSYLPARGLSGRQAEVPWRDDPPEQTSRI